MAKVLFFVQLILALGILPFWPGLEPRFAWWGAGFLVLSLSMPLGACVAVFGVADTTNAVADVWSTRSLGSRGDRSRQVWTLAAEVFPGSGLAAGLGVLMAAVPLLGSDRPFLAEAPLLVFFAGVWAILGLLLSRIFAEVVRTWSKAAPLGASAQAAALGPRFALTPRETEVAALVLDGLSYKDAAERLGVSASTVKTHILKVYEKTGAGTKLELLRLVEAEFGRIHQTADGAEGPLARN